MDKYLEHLQAELKRAIEDFESAKKNAAEEILKMPAHIAVDYGAGYASHVENITKEAARIKAISYDITAYKHFSNN